DGLSAFEPKDLQNLGVGRAIARVERAEFDFNLEVQQPESIEEAEARQNRAAILASSRSQYAGRREEVEQSEPGPSETHTKPSVTKTGERTADARPSKPHSQEPDSSETTPPIPPSKPTIITSAPSEVVRAPGRGGPQHKYLQSLLKTAGEDRGYRVTTEKRV